MKKLSLCFLIAAGGLLAAEKTSEMDHYRQINERSAATVQDLVDLILMTEGEFLKYPTADKRFEYARNSGWIKNQQPGEPLNRGTLAYAIVLNFNVTRGLLFRLTKFNHYALRDVQEAGILSPRLSEGNKVSGAQLVGAISVAEEYKTEKEQWSANH